MTESNAQPNETAGYTLYTFVEEDTSTAEAMPSWPRLHNQFPTVIGFSRLGHVFLFSKEHGEAAVIYPLEGTGKKYLADTIEEFKTGVLDDPDFITYTQPAATREQLVAHVGPIDGDEVYYPVPYPVLGGSGEIETYESGDVWVFLDILGQIWLSAEQSQ